MHTTQQPDDAESKKAVFRRLVELYALGDVSALDELMAPDYVGHTALGDRDLEELRQSIRHFHTLFIYAPDSLEINDQFGKIVEEWNTCEQMQASKSYPG